MKITRSGLIDTGRKRVGQRGGKLSKRRMKSPNEGRSFHGLNDKVSEATAVGQTGSLLLIAPTRLDLVVGMESQYMAPDRRRVRANFDFNDIQYNFVVTDPWIEDKYFAGENGTYRINGSRLCISLPEIINGYSTKLVAAVIVPERLG